MRAQLLILATVSAMLSLLPLGGCARRAPQPQLGPVPSNAFVKAWGADLRLGRDGVDRLFLLDDLVVLYTKSNRAITLSASGGELLASNPVVSPQQSLRPPVLLGDNVVFPTLTTFEVYTRRGRMVGSVPTERATRSPSASDGRVLYVGLDYGRGGRLAKIDITRAYGRTLWELMTFGSISAAPAVFDNVIYCGSEDGRIYAVAEDRSPVWPMEGNTFVTAGPIYADLKADEFGVYVASTDSKLYCLDRTTGRIKWQYFATVPLRSSPIVTRDRVYQLVPNRGLVAIDKLEGESFRQPLWTARNARQFLSTDDQYVYVLDRGGAVVALSKADGTPQFTSQRRDFTISAPNTRDSMIYACTRRGEVIAVRPVLRPGTVGEVVFQEQLLHAAPLAQAR